MHKILHQDLQKMSFPGDFAEDQTPKTRRCMLFGEADSAIPGGRLDPSEMTTFFHCFYNGIIPDRTIWFAYKGKKNMFESPLKFDFKSVDSDATSLTNLGEAITLRILPVYFSAGESHQLSYEFYHRAAVSHQFGLGQLPIRSFFASLEKLRELVDSGMEYNQLKNLMHDAETIDLEGWIVTPFAPKPFRQWWLEWCSHLFCTSTTFYYQKLDPSYAAPSNEVTCHATPLSFHNPI